MSKSLLYAVNSTVQTIATGGALNFGSTIRRFGCNCKNNGSTITLDGTGYYTVQLNVTMSSTTAATNTLAIYADGVAVPGATVTETIAANGTNTVTVIAVIRNKCCNDNTLTCTMTGDGATVSNTAILVEKE